MEEEEKILDVSEKREPGTNERYCSECGAIIKRTAEICPKCGTRQFSQQPQKNPGIAAIASALAPGLGQIYNGEILKGIVLLVLAGIFGFLAIITIGILGLPYLLIWLYAVYNAYKTAEKINAGMASPTG